MPDFSNPTFDQQVDYVLRWLNDCDRYGRLVFGDAIYKLTQASNVELTELGEKLNGMRLTGPDGGYPTLFQCRIKVTREWYCSWDDSMREVFVSRLSDYDSKLLSDSQDIEQESIPPPVIGELPNEDEEEEPPANPIPPRHVTDLSHLAHPTSPISSSYVASHVTNGYAYEEDEALGPEDKPDLIRNAVDASDF